MHSCILAGRTGVTGYECEQDLSLVFLIRSDCAVSAVHRRSRPAGHLLFLH